MWRVRGGRGGKGGVNGGFGGGGPEEKTPLGRPRHKWEDNIKMDFQDVRGGGID